MSDMRTVITAKTDQLNADELIGGPITIRVASVTLRPGTEQPCSVSFEGDNGKPYKPCLSMRRVMTMAWGPDANAYTGRGMTLFRDPKARFGGQEVGGVRISHMSHIDKPMTFALTETKGKRAPYTVHPLRMESVQAPVAGPDVGGLIAACKTAADKGKDEFLKHWKTLSKADRAAVEAAGAMADLQDRCARADIKPAPTISERIKALNDPNSIEIQNIGLDIDALPDDEQDALRAALNVRVAEIAK